MAPNPLNQFIKFYLLLILVAKNQLHWNLDDVVKLEDYDSLFSEVEEKIGLFDKFYQGMEPGMETEDFKEFIHFCEDISKKTSRLYAMPYMMKSVDQKSEKARLFIDRTNDLNVKIDDASRKLWHWVKGKNEKDGKVLDDENAKRLFKSVPDLEYVLARKRELARYTLSEPEESIISKKDTILGEALTDLRELVETDFTYFFKPEGVKRGRTIKTLPGIIKYVQSPSPEERAAAYTTIFEKFRDNIDKFFIIYRAIAKDWATEAKIRGYDSPISVRNVGNGVPDEAIETLLDVCSENRGIYQDYFRFKAKELGMGRLRRFDVYAPLEKKEGGEKGFPDALKLVLEALDSFSGGFGKRARRIVDSGHIDSHPGENKRAGGYCYTVTPDIVPYIMLNYSKKQRDVMTLAHELGHGIHSLYSSHHSASSRSAPLPLAETASTFAEMVVFEKLLEGAKSDKVRKSMLSDKMGDSFATVLRQNYFVKFEVEAHKSLMEGVTASELSETYFGALREQFGDSVEIDPLFKYEWAYVPHIVRTPFYCYAYNFGDLLSMALFSEYKKEGEGFIPKIEKILSYGGSEDPQKVLGEVGIDMGSREFWQSSFDIIRGWQKDLEKFE